MPTLAETLAGFAALRLGSGEPIEKRNPWWSQQSRDALGRWSKGLVVGAYSPVTMGGKPKVGDVAPQVTAPGTITGQGGSQHGTGTWQSHAAVGAPAKSNAWQAQGPVEGQRASGEPMSNGALSGGSAGTQGTVAPTMDAPTREPGPDREPAKPPEPTGWKHVTGWKQVGPQGGSNPGGVFEDPDGKRHYVKFYANGEQGQSEVLANSIYRALGINAPDSKNLYVDGKKAVAAPMISGVQPGKLGAEDLRTSNQVKNGFVADAFLANHDVVGTGYDNVVFDHEKNAHRIDNGGSMFFRAMGEPKAGGPAPFVANDVPEIDSMRNPKIAQYAGKVFGYLTDEQLASQAKDLVAKLPDEKIDALVAAAGFTGKKAEEYASTLKGRRDALAQRFISAQDAATLTPATAQAEAPPEPPAAPAPPPVESSNVKVDPDHPQSELYAKDPGLKSWAVANVLASALGGQKADAIAGAKNPKVAEKILETKFHDKYNATLLGVIATHASNEPHHVEANADGTFSIKPGVQPISDDAPTYKQGSKELYDAVQAVDKPNIANATDAIGAWKFKGRWDPKVKAAISDPATLKGVTHKVFGSYLDAQAAAGLLKHALGTGAHVVEHDDGSFQAEIDSEHGVFSPMPLAAKHGFAPHGLPSPEKIDPGFEEYVDGIGDLPTTKEQLAEAIKQKSESGNTVAAVWLQSYGATHDLPSSEPKVVAPQEPETQSFQSGSDAIKHAKSLASVSGLPSFLWTDDGEVHVTTNAQEAKKAEASGKKIFAATGKNQFLAEATPEHFAVADRGKPQSAVSGEAAQYPNGKLNPLHAMKNLNPDHKTVSALESKKVLNQNLHQNLKNLASSPKGLSTLLATTYGKWKIAQAAASAIMASTGHMVSVKGGYGKSGATLQVSNDAQGKWGGEFSKHPHLGGTVGTSSVSPPQPSPTPKPVAPVVPYESSLKAKHDAQTEFQPGTPLAAINELGSNPYAEHPKIPHGISPLEAMTTDHDSQRSIIDTMEAHGRIDAANWLRAHYDAINDEAESPDANEKVTYGHDANLPSPFHTPSQIINAMATGKKARPSGVNDWMLYAHTPEEQAAAIQAVKSGNSAHAGKAAGWLDRFYQQRAAAHAPASEHFVQDPAAVKAAHHSFSAPISPKTDQHYGFHDPSYADETKVTTPSKQSSPLYHKATISQPAYFPTHLTISGSSKYSDVQDAAKKQASTLLSQARADHEKMLASGQASTDPFGSRPAKGVAKQSAHAFNLTLKEYAPMLQTARASLPSKEVLEHIATMTKSRNSLRKLAAAVAQPMLEAYGVTGDEYKRISKAIKSWQSDTLGSDIESASANRLRVMSNMLRGLRPDSNVFRGSEFDQISSSEANGIAAQIPAGEMRALLVHKAVSEAMFERYVDESGTATLERGIGAGPAKTMAGKTFAYGVDSSDIGRSVQAHELTVSGYTIDSTVSARFGKTGAKLIRQVMPRDVWHGQFLSPVATKSFDDEAEIFCANPDGGGSYTVTGDAPKTFGNFITQPTKEAAHGLKEQFGNLASLSAARTVGDLVKSGYLDFDDGDDQELAIPKSAAEWYRPAPPGFVPSPAHIAALRKAFTTPDGVFHLFPDCDPGWRDNPSGRGAE